MEGGGGEMIVYRFLGLCSYFHHRFAFLQYFLQVYCAVILAVEMVNCVLWTVQGLNNVTLFGSDLIEQKDYLNLPVLCLWNGDLPPTPI